MKTFGKLYCYELKKLLKRKLSWVMVLLLAGPTPASGGSGVLVYRCLSWRYWAQWV